MMGSKVFAEKGRVKLVGDDRDVGISALHRNKVWQWCADKGIEVEYQGTLKGTDLWRVRDEKHRMWFVLRWA